jgi:acetyl-CoA carboxylase biotin carboxyl carrier protein
MIGVFYRRPAPGADAFAKPGDRVEADTTIGIIEIMKLMNPITAGKAGVLGEFLAQDAQAVEFGTPLVVIDTNA